MISNIKFSIIITCYNQQDYISSCICSIKKQTHPLFECIIVDDGSCDNSVDVIREQIKDDIRFKLLTQANGGVTSARNAALSHISGHFTTFLDGDDELETDCLEKCSHYTGDRDLLIFGITNVYYKGDGETYQVTASPYEACFESGSELADWYVKNHAILLYSCGNKMYRTSVIHKNGLKFAPEISWGEDRLFNYRFLTFCKGIRSVEDCFYRYRHIDEQSLTRGFRTRHIDTLLMLHTLKMEHLLPAATGASYSDKAAYMQYDIQKEVRNAFLHIAEHMDELSGELLEEEYRHLDNAQIPEYFYGSTTESGAKRSAPGLRNWITDKVYGSSEKYQTKNPDVVIILGSRSCAYRVDAAMKQFGHLDGITYICSGGNLSEYTDCSGNELIEADYIRNRLLENGIQDDLIITEKDSRNTYENIVNSIELYNALSPQNHSVKYTVVTAGFHQTRVRRLLESAGYDADIFCADGPNTNYSDWYKNPTGINIVFDELAKLTGRDG